MTNVKPVETPTLTLGFVLREFRKTFDYLTMKDDLPGLNMADNFRACVNSAYNFGVQWDPYISIVDPAISSDAVIPDNVRETYIACTIRAYEVMYGKKIEELGK
jgi:hypothetical protein